MTGEEIKKERKKKGRKEMREWLERNGTEPEKQQMENKTICADENRTDGRTRGDPASLHWSAAVRLISLPLVSLVLKEEGNVKGAGQECG
jgi:hypothetical protein